MDRRLPSALSRLFSSKQWEMEKKAFLGGLCAACLYKWRTDRDTHVPRMESEKVDDNICAASGRI